MDATEKSRMDPSISVSVPVFDNRGSFNAWKAKFTAYCSLVNLSEERKLQLLPLCFSGWRFDATLESLDGRSILSSIFGKIQPCIRQERPADPFQDFVDRSWLPDETASEFVRELRLCSFFFKFT